MVAGGRAGTYPRLGPRGALRVNPDVLGDDGALLGKGLVLLELWQVLVEIRKPEKTAVAAAAESTKPGSIGARECSQ